MNRAVLVIITALIVTGFLPAAYGLQSASAAEQTPRYGGILKMSYNTLPAILGDPTELGGTEERCVVPMCLQHFIAYQKGKFVPSSLTTAVDV